MKQTHNDDSRSILKSRSARVVLPLVAALFAFALAAPSARAAVTCYEYMTITGTANTQGSGVYVNTGYKPNGETIVRAKFASASSSSSNNNQFLFCSRKSYDNNNTEMLHFSFAPNVGGKFRFDYYGTHYAASESFTANGPYEIEVKGGKATVTKVSGSMPTNLGPSSAATFSATYPLVLFQSYTMSGTSPGGWGNAFRGTFYYLQVFEIENGEEVLKHHFVPCTEDGTVKICDLADSKRTYALTKTSNGAANVTGAHELTFNRPVLGAVTLVRTNAATYSLTAAEDANAADLAWIANNGSTATTNGWQSVAEGGTANWTVSDLAADTTYKISVLATNENGTAEVAAGSLYTGELAFGATTDAYEKGLVAGGVTVSRAAADPFPLTVNYEISGSVGSQGVTWAAPAAVTIPANAKSAVLPVIPLLDPAVEENVTITVTLAAGNYEIPAASTTLTLRDRYALKTADFSRKMTLTPSETALEKIGKGTFTDFPVLVRLPAAVTDMLLSANGSDLFFADENDARLSFEIETFNPGGTTFIWVKVPSLSSATRLTLYFAGPANIDNNPADVWSNYVGVWHFDADAAGTTTVADATGHGLDGTTTDAMTAVEGPFGDLCLNSTASISAPDYEADFSVGATFTASGWFTAPTMAWSDYAGLAKKKGSKWDAANGWYMQMHEGKCELILTGSVPKFDLSGVQSSWHHFQLVSGGGRVKLYIDGNTSPKINNGYTVIANSEPYVIQSPKMYSDEYRIRKSAASAEETALEYATMADASFFTLGTIQSVDPAAQSFATPTVVRNGNGSYTVSVELLENNGDVGVIYDAGTTAITNIIQSNATPATYTDTPANLANGTTYRIAAYGKNANGSQIVEKGGIFYNGDLSVTVLSNAFEYGLAPGAIRVSREDTAHDLVVALSVGGSAVAGQTYEALPTTVTIPAGATFVDVPVQPLRDDSVTADATVVVTPAPGFYGVSALTGTATLTVKNIATLEGYNTWIAASDGLASVGSNWSAGHTPTAGENVLFDGNISQANCEWDSAASATVASWTQTNGYTGTVTVDTVFPEKGAFTVLTVSGDMNVASGTVTHKEHTSTYKVDQYRLRIDVGGNLTVASGAKITARGKGSYGARAEGASSYGGSYNGNASWGSLTEPYGVGSSANGNATIIAFAGGAIWLEVAGATKLDGSINANGIAAKPSYDTLGGSGGAVYLKTGTLSGAGSVSANCEQTGISSNDRSGAGGRVSILLTSGELDSFPSANLTALSGYPSYANVGGAGTVLVRSPLKPNGILFLRDRSDRYSNWGGIYSYRPNPGQLTRIPANKTWVLDGIVFGPYAILQVPTGTTLDLRGGFASVSSTATALDETGLIVDGGTLLLPSAETHTISGKWIFEPKDYTLAGNLVVTNGAGVGTLMLYSATSNDVRTCGLTVSGNMHVATNSYLRAVRGGYIATGAATVGGGSTSCHGGQCGKSTSNVAYDSFFHPRHPGTFGADNGKVNVGGGAIRLVVGGTLTLDGVASATPIPKDDRSGAPGSIDITAGRLEGAGLIEANGNSRNYSDDDSGNSSGGGRVAVRLTGAGETFSDAWVSKINAKGYYTSKYSASRSSSAGSIYLQTADQAEGAGTIIVRNTGNTANNVAFTAIPSLKAGGEEDDFRRASLKTEAAARVKLFAKLRMARLDMASGTVLDLNGKQMIVDAAKMGDGKIMPGTYTAADEAVAGFVIDTADGAGGELIITGGGFSIIVR